MDEERPSRRQSWSEGPIGAGSGEHEWLSLTDDDLLYQIASLPGEHGADDALISIVRSNRHFFVRQEAAKRVRDPSRLRELWDDRHVGQILVRGLTRNEDIDYLRKLLTHSRHLDVRNAAQAQLDNLMRNLAGPGPSDGTES